MFCAQCGSAVAESSRFCATCGARMTDPASLDGTGLPEPGEALLASVRRALAADYDVEREVGRGGMAVVFKGREKELERTVALKVLPPDLAPVSSIADRFKREARLAASLDHPNIIPVYRVGYTGGVLYMAMKYIDGRALDGLVASQGPLPLPVVLTVLRATARAMAYAHEHGIVHRDIKGANILIDRNGRVIVSDFGIARAMESAALTATGLMIGTPHYMSPEQCAGKQAGVQADQYALGIVAYQLLTGAVPFDGESLPEILQQHCFTPAPDPSIARPDSPAVLTAIVQRLLAKEPEQRFGSTADLVAALDNIPFTEGERAAGESALKALVRARSSLPPVHPHPLEAGIAPHISAPVPNGANGAANRTSPSSVLRVSDIQAAAAQGPPPPAITPPPPVTPRPIATRPISMDPAIDEAKTVATASAAAGMSSVEPQPARPVAPVASRPRTAARPGVRRQPSRPMRWPAIAGICLATCLIAGFAVARRYTATAAPTAARPRPDAALLRRYGHRAYVAGDYEIARRFYVRAIRLDPANRDAQAQQELGCALVKLGSADSTQLAHPVRKGACSP
jgi:serine/threonine protein kinase